MIARVLSGLLLILLHSSIQTAGTYSWCNDCGPLQLDGPINGLPVIQANCNDPVMVTCQVTLTNTDFLFNPRLQMSLTAADGQLCTLLSGNGSDSRLEEGCADIRYTYYYETDIENRVMTFLYHIKWISILDKSIVSCGVQYLSDNCPEGDLCSINCIAETPALIQLQDEQECITTAPTTTETAETTMEATTAMEATTVPPTNETIPTELPTNSTTESPPETPTTESPPKTTTTESPPKTTTELPTNSSTTVPTFVDRHQGLDDVEGETVAYIVAAMSLVLVVSLIGNVVLFSVAIRRKKRNTDKERGEGGTLERSLETSTTTFIKQNGFTK